VIPSRIVAVISNDFWPAPFFSFPHRCAMCLTGLKCLNNIYTTIHTTRLADYYRLVFSFHPVGCFRELRAGGVGCIEKKKKKNKLMMSFFSLQYRRAKLTHPLSLIRFLFFLFFSAGATITTTPPSDQYLIALLCLHISKRGGE
jgi:hypothetical protein